MAEFNESVS